MFGKGADSASHGGTCDAATRADEEGAMSKLFWLTFIACCSGCAAGEDTHGVTAGPPEDQAKLAQEVIVLDGLLHPLRDARVIAYGPSFEVLAEATSGENGAATLAGVAWGARPRTLVASKDGYSLTLELVTATSHEATLRTLGRDPGTPHPLVLERCARSTPELSGTFTGLMAETSRILLSGPIETFEGGADGYAIHVPPAVSATFVAAEWAGVMGFDGIEAAIYQWRQLEAPGIFANTTHALDFATGEPLEAHTTTGEIILPGGPAGPFAGFLGYSLGLTGSPLLVSGLTTHSARTQDGAGFRHAIEFVDPVVPGPRFQVVRLLAPDGAVSDRVFAGLPNARAVQDFDLPVRPLAARQSLFDPIDLSGAPPGSTRILAALHPSGDLWLRAIVPAEVELEQLQLPRLDDALLGALPKAFSARLYTLREPFEGTRLARWMTGSSAFVLTR